MRNNDEIAIFESYKDEILKKFKDSLSDENDNTDNEDLNMQDDIGNDDMEDTETEQEDKPKKKVVVKSDELSTNVGPKLREILRALPPVSEDSDILSLIKRAIEKINSRLENEEEHIKATPLSIYDKMIELNAISEEEMDADKFEDFDPEKEPDVLQNFEDDDYSEFDDEIDDRERDWKKEDLRGKWEDIIKDMGTDWRKDDEDFYSSNY